MTEADTCREFVTPKLVEAGWGAAESVIGEQRSFTNGRIIVAGGKVRRGKQRRADYLLYYRRDFPLALVEAKEGGLPAETGVQQTREYAEMLGLKFAYATIHLEKTKSGTALLQKLSSLPADDIAGLDRLLTEWTVKDALRVLDEIDGRISVIEAIRRLAGDPHTDELHTLHPLILRSRWLFGPEFESQEYCSNVTLQTVARELFKRTEAQFINERHRPDIVVLPEKTTWQMAGIESFDPVDSTLTQMQHVLVIELKKGGFELTRKEVNQADGYVQDIAASGAMSGSPFICAWVVGQKIAAGVERDKQLGNPAYGRVRAATFGSLVDTANARLLRLRTVLADRYGGSSTDELLNRVFCGRPKTGWESDDDRPQ